MTAEQLEELLGRTTPNWCVYSEPEVGLEPALFAGRVGHKGFGPIEPLQGYDLRLAALAPYLARRVLSAEKLVEALAKLGTPSCFGSGEVLGMYLPESPMGREIIARMGFAKDAIIAYREASK